MNNSCLIINRDGDETAIFVTEWFEALGGKPVIVNGRKKLKEYGIAPPENELMEK